MAVFLCICGLKYWLEWIRKHVHVKNVKNSHTVAVLCSFIMLFNLNKFKHLSEDANLPCVWKVSIICKLTMVKNKKPSGFI